MEKTTTKTATVSRSRRDVLKRLIERERRRVSKKRLTQTHMNYVDSYAKHLLQTPEKKRPTSKLTKPITTALKSVVIQNSARDTSRAKTPNPLTSESQPKMGDERKRPYTGHRIHQALEPCVTPYNDDYNARKTSIKITTSVGRTAELSHVKRIHNQAFKLHTTQNSIQNNTILR